MATPEVPENVGQTIPGGKYYIPAGKKYYRCVNAQGDLLHMADLDLNPVGEDDEPTKKTAKKLPAKNAGEAE